MGILDYNGVITDIVKKELNLYSHLKELYMVDIIAWYTPGLSTVLLLVLTWQFGDWRNWRKYYPTILFIVLVKLVVGRRKDKPLHKPNV